MAKRIVFLPTDSSEKGFFDEVLVEFEWIPGIAISQAKKSIRNLHEAAKQELGIDRVLEVSTRSEEVLGIALSAFNLKIPVNGVEVSVESAYQASKFFQDGGPYLDILASSSLKAKKDPRLKTSGRLLGFSFDGLEWPMKSAPNFYDYLFISGLLQFPNRSFLSPYQAFTDIAFSQISLNYKSGRSYNCQARSVAIYLSLRKQYSESHLLEALKMQCLISDTTTEQLGLF